MSLTPAVEVYDGTAHCRECDPGSGGCPGLTAGDVIMALAAAGTTGSPAAVPDYPDEAISAGATALDHGDYPGCSCANPREHAGSMEGDRTLAEMILDAAAPVIIAAERERWAAILKDHYLMGINCDPDTKRDNPMCGCSRIFLGWHDSIGEARRAWIGHVLSVVGEG